MAPQRTQRALAGIKHRLQHLQVDNVGRTMQKLSIGGGSPVVPGGPVGHRDHRPARSRAPSPTDTLIHAVRAGAPDVAGVGQVPRPAAATWFTSGQSVLRETEALTLRFRAIVSREAGRIGVPPVGQEAEVTFRELRRLADEFKHMLLEFQVSARMIAEPASREKGLKALGHARRRLVYVWAKDDIKDVLRRRREWNFQHSRVNGNRQHGAAKAKAARQAERLRMKRNKEEELDIHRRLYKVSAKDLVANHHGVTKDQGLKMKEYTQKLYNHHFRARQLVEDEAALKRVKSEFEGRSDGLAIRQRVHDQGMELDAPKKQETRADGSTNPNSGEAARKGIKPEFKGRSEGRVIRQAIQAMELEAPRTQETRATGSTNPYTGGNAMGTEGGEKIYLFGALAFVEALVDHRTTGRFLVDGGSMMNIMDETLQRQLNLTIQSAGMARLKTADGGMSNLLGVSKRLPITIGPITTYLHFYIRQSSPNIPTILGKPFLQQVRALIGYRESDGQVVMTLRKDGIRFDVEVTPADQPGPRTYTVYSGANNHQNPQFRGV